jgi:NADH dehydrogenase (ubiquinone) 1 beta subcomplex subunit 10
MIGCRSRGPGKIMVEYTYSPLTLMSQIVLFYSEKWIEPMQAKNRGVYYHRQFRRVPTIDQCYENDQMCIYEANEQMKRDK